LIIESQIVPIDSIHPNSWNVNVMKASVYSFLKRSIKKVGFVQPIVITKDNVIIDGEHRWKAIKELGFTEVEVKVLDMTEDEAKASTINFNMTKGVLDSDKLGRMLHDMEMGMGKDALQEMLVLEKKQIEKAIRDYQRDKVPQPSVARSTETTVKEGDIYWLGTHKLICGDSLTWEGEPASIVLTDPPYNVGYKYLSHTDDMSAEGYEWFVKKYMAVAKACAPFVVVTPGKVNEHIYYKNFKVIDSAVWNKGFALTNGTCYKAMVTEPVLFFGEKPTNKFLNTDLLTFHTDREEGLLEMHSCPKPLGLYKEIITGFTDLGDVVVDIFGGSGTTLLACEMTNRLCVTVEKDPVYCQGIIDRFVKNSDERVEKE
jgi:hypothetical protein